jgi:hypothetical protein
MMSDIKNNIYKPDPLRVDASYEVFKLITTLSLKVLKVDVPFFALPIVSQLTDFIFHFVGKALFFHLSKFLTFQIIDAQTNTELSSVQESLKRLNKSYESHDPSEIEKSKEKLQEDFSRLVKL